MGRGGHRWIEVGGDEQRWVEVGIDSSLSQKNLFVELKLHNFSTAVYIHN